MLGYVECSWQFKAKLAQNTQRCKNINTAWATAYFEFVGNGIAYYRL